MALPSAASGMLSVHRSMLIANLLLDADLCGVSTAFLTMVPFDLGEGFLFTIVCKGG